MDNYVTMGSHNSPQADCLRLYTASTTLCATYAEQCFYGLREL